MVGTTAGRDVEGQAIPISFGSLLEQRADSDAARPVGGDVDVL